MTCPVSCSNVMTASIHRMAEVKNDVDALSWSAQLAVYLMKAYELMAHCVGKFAKAVIVLTKASGFLEATQLIGKIGYFVTGEVKKDAHRVFKILGKIIMTVADVCVTTTWLAMVGLIKLGRHAATIGIVGSVFAISGLTAYSADAIQRLVRYSGQAGKGVHVADASLNLIASVAEITAIFCALVTGQIVILIALGILAKSLSLTSYIFSQANASKLKAPA